MPGQRVILAAAAMLGATAGLAACSGKDDRPAPPASGARGGTGGDGGTGGTDGANGSSGTGGSAGQAGGAGAGGSDPDGSAGAAGGGNGGNAGDGSDAAGGMGGEPEPDAGGTCGNGLLEIGEGCEGSDFGGKTCRSYGYELGSLGCLACGIDIRDCSGSERCGNGRDDDADSAVDCADADCAAACADACNTPELIPDASEITSTTLGHASVSTPSCVSAGASSAGEVVFQVEVERNGVLAAKLTSGVDLNLSVRRSCADADSELGCTDRATGTAGVEGLVVPARRGESLFVVVDGSGESGAFTLEVGSRQVVCGDTHRDLDEECDDGNQESNDGCSETCVLEPTEVEPNDSVAQATLLSAPGTSFGAISPAGDADVYSVDVLLPNSMIDVQIVDLNDGACPNKLLDSYLEILGTDGTSVLADNDDYGGGYCSRTTAWSLVPGKYYVRVTASSATPSFAYGLTLRR
jgi:cysteine-rich repeat protein